MALTLAIGNQKGGVGKTALVTGLTDALRNRGKTVLVVDADPQANASTRLDVTEPEVTLNDVLYQVNAPEDEGAAAGAIVPAGEGWDNVFVVPSERKLAAREKDDSVNRDMRLKMALAGVADKFDFVIIDCPPSLGSLTANALIAADEVLIVTEPRSDAVEGVGEFVTTMANVRAYFNNSLAMAGIVINRFRPNRTDPQLWLVYLRENYQDLVIEPQGLIPDREVVAQAAAAHVPVSSFGSRALDVWRPLKHIGDVMIERAAERAALTGGVVSRG
ncbi:chromosome partitioning protein [Georgenia soli]|uniref:Chromosome partitioning protein n=1 Tax=Georgenia soli TaxID=638953 RepID=A0A2A9F3V6_9MICO|nr:AAA family ATPase [Georgenia soli]PFG45135.1 chromosome partitioning protein [Georgenia soli]